MIQHLPDSAKHLLVILETCDIFDPDPDPGGGALTLFGRILIIGR
jgi:hypothetical protein